MLNAVSGNQNESAKTSSKTRIGAGASSCVLTRRPIRRRGSPALVGRIDVEDLDPSCGPVVD